MDVASAGLASCLGTKRGLMQLGQVSQEVTITSVTPPEQADLSAADVRAFV